MAAGRSFLTAQARRLAWRALTLAARDPIDDLGKTAIVFAPHADDETLGCGGTIINKVIAGADVRVVFVTDGCGSHSRLISHEQLKAIRTREARAAAEVLGVKPANLIFLEFKDRTLVNNLSAAGREVLDVLLDVAPDEVFVPYCHESVADHFATNRIVLSAIRKSRRAVRIYEYPVWFWADWPWVSEPLQKLDVLAWAKGSFLAAMRLLRDFRWAVYVGDVLDRKRAAMDRYASQMTRLIPDPRWATLSDVADGEFLKCFFRDYEIYRCYTFAGC